MPDSIWPTANGSRKPLPKPNVVVAKPGTSPEQLTPEAIKGILVNPIYAGVGPYPALVDDATWVRCSAKLIAEEGPEQFLVNLLYVLRESFHADILPPIAEQPGQTYQGKTIGEWITDLKNKDSATHNKACDVLERIGKPAVPALADALNDQAGLARALAASVLMNMGSIAEAAVPALIETLQDPDPVVRLRAAQALVKITPDHNLAIPTLIDSLQVEVDFARADAASILGDLGPDAGAAIPALVEALRDRSDAVRKAASEALRSIQGL